MATSDVLQTPFEKQPGNGENFSPALVNMSDPSSVRETFAGRSHQSQEDAFKDGHLNFGDIYGGTGSGASEQTGTGAQNLMTTELQILKDETQILSTEVQMIDTLATDYSALLNAQASVSSAPSDSQPVVAPTTPTDGVPVTSPTNPIDSAPVSPGTTANDGTTASSAANTGTTATTAPESTSNGSSYTVYNNGQMNWAGDFSSNANIDYHDTTGNAPGGGQDIKMSPTGSWALFQPYSAVPGNFNDTPYKDITFEMKGNGDPYQIVAHNSGDQIAGPGMDLSQFAETTPQAGQWTTYKVPLNDLGIANETGAYKFLVQDDAASPNGATYFDDIQFTS